VVKAYPKPKEIYGGFLIFTLDKYPAICQHVSDLAANNKDPRVNAMVGLVRMPPEMLHIIILMPLVFGSADYAKKALSWAFELGPIQDLSGPMTYEKALEAQGEISLILFPLRVHSPFCRYVCPSSGARYHIPAA
jgi:hypothetical protein